LAFVVTVLYQLFVAKPSNVWEVIEPFVWLLCLMLAVHWVWSMVDVWRTYSCNKSPIGSHVITFQFTKGTIGGNSVTNVGTTVK
jgi:hypothetical protein